MLNASVKTVKRNRDGGVAYDNTIKGSYLVLPDIFLRQRFYAGHNGHAVKIRNMSAPWVACAVITSGIPTPVYAKTTGSPYTLRTF